MLRDEDCGAQKVFGSVTRDGGGVVIARHGKGPAAAGLARGGETQVDQEALEVLATRFRRDEVAEVIVPLGAGVEDALDLFDEEGLTNEPPGGYGAVFAR